MRCSHALLAGGLVAAVLIGGCATRNATDELGAKESVLPNSLPNYSTPLDLREFDVDGTDSGARGVFLKLSRLPSAVSSSSQNGPARIIVDIQGPTGSESPEEVFPGGDSLVTHVAVTRQVGGLRVVIDLALDEPPEFVVLPMADWVLVRIAPPSPRKRPWAHSAS